MLLDSLSISRWYSMVVIATDQCWSAVAVPCIEGPCEVVSVSVAVQPLHHLCDIVSLTVILAKLGCDDGVLVGHWFDVLVPAVLVVAVVEVVAVPDGTHVAHWVVGCILAPLSEGIGPG